MRYRISVRYKGQTHYYIVQHGAVDKTQPFLEAHWNNSSLFIPTSSSLIGRRGFKRRYYNLDKKQKQNLLATAALWFSFSKAEGLGSLVFPKVTGLCGLLTVVGISSC